MGVFGGIKGAKYSEGGVYLTPGVFALEIVACKYKKTRTGKDAFIAEFVVRESSDTARLPGSTCSWMVTLDKEPALGNIKQFLCTVLGCEEDKVDESVVEYSIDEKANPLKGRTVRASCVNIKTKAGRDFTKVKFLPFEMNAADVAAEHAKQNGSQAA